MAGSMGALYDRLPLKERSLSPMNFLQDIMPTNSSMASFYSFV